MAIILLNWNSRVDTLECLESVFRLDYPDFRVVVCDNNSSDGSLESIQEWAEGRVSIVPASSAFAAAFGQPRPKKALGWIRYSRDEAAVGQEMAPDLVLIETGANLGFAGGNNVGIHYALRQLRPDYLWLLNTDTLVERQSLAALVDRASRDNTIGMVGSSLIYYWEPNKVQALGGATLSLRTTRTHHIGEGSPANAIPDDASEVESRMAYVVGASMLVSREFVEQVGPMQEDYFLYFEEIDWAERSRRSSSPFKLAFAPKSVVYHKVGASAGTHNQSLLSVGYLAVNRLRFFKRFYPGHLPIARLVVFWEGMKALLKGRMSAAKAIMRAALAPVRL